MSAIFREARRQGAPTEVAMEFAAGVREVKTSSLVLPGTSEHPETAVIERLFDYELWDRKKRGAALPRKTWQ